MSSLSESQTCPTCGGYGRVPAGDRSAEELHEAILAAMATPRPRMAARLAERERAEQNDDAA